MVTLTNVGSSYDAIAASQGLGIQDIDFTGVTSVLFKCKVNKVGTGIQSWQVWNESDGSQIGVIDDGGTAGIKTLSASFTVALAGVKLVRIRAKSTVAADDPVYLGSSLLPRV